MPKKTHSHVVRSSSRRNVALLAALEPRIMMHADPLDPTHHDVVPLELFPPITAGTTAGSTTTTTSAASSPLSAVPQLSSRPSAYAKIYLDFDGDTTSTWGSYSPGTTPAYDTDGDPTTFSDAEISSMREIWSRVAEKYSAFNVDVTTVNPGNLNNGQTVKAVIGGDGAWLGAQAGGVAYVGSFTNSAPNTVFVFPKNLANGYAQYVAEGVAHETGHAFGLQHQGTWSGSTLTNEYNPGNGTDAPIMGNSYQARRGLWWYGTASDSPTHIQDDLSVISSSTNGFGYRADDFGNSIAAASTLSLSGTSLSGAGVIEKTSDSDVFSFTAGAGNVNFTVAPAAFGGMLDAKLDLRDATGAVLAAADSSSLGESLSATLGGGTYYLTVSSHGAYGDIGQYSVTGSESAIITPINAPTSLSATASSSTTVDLAWTDNATNESGYTIQRSSDNGATWTNVGSVGANVTAYRDSTVVGGTTYTYRVFAFDSSQNSPYSNTATVTTPQPVVSGVPAAPTSLSAQSLSSSATRLYWKDNSSNETGFKVYISTDGRTFSYLGTVGANVTSVDVTGLRRNTVYYYKVSATNASGDSPYSNVASVRTAKYSTTMFAATPAAATLNANTAVKKHGHPFSAIPIPVVNKLLSHKRHPFFERTNTLLG